MAAEKALVDTADTRLGHLHAIIERHSVKRGEFTLSSGRSSNFLFQLRQTTMMPEGAALIGEMIVDFMRRHQLRTVGGLEMGAVPIVAAVAVASYHADYPVDAFFVRKSAKAHGARERVDGHLVDGADVLLIDDVATTGGSILRALEGLREEYPHCQCSRAFSVIDREEGASESLAEHGIALAAIFGKSDFGL
ncbi:MAG TPA: orotate phosphoribosyltransferase [Rhizomicrobium sp.]|jgi:orotate phosphoribosyltransferase